jgi:hypothetical protein
LMHLMVFLWMSREMIRSCYSLKFVKLFRFYIKSHNINCF